MNDVPMYRVALNGLTANSPSADHVWAVFGAWGEDGGRYWFDLTYAEAVELAARKNGH